jgi:hypothetical protein
LAIAASYYGPLPTSKQLPRAQPPLQQRWMRRRVTLPNAAKSL